MWCLSCFKPPNTVDTFEAETDIALEVSRHEAEVQEAEQLASALRESSRLIHQQKEEEEEEERRRRRDRALENDEQLARAYQYEEERETQMDHNNHYTSALEEEEHLALALQESYRLLRQQEKEEEEKKRARELEKDAQIANGVLYEEREREREIAKSVEKEKEKRRKFEEQVKKDAQIAKDLKRKQFEEQSKKDAQIAKDLKRKEFEEQVKKDEQIAKDLKRKQFEEQEKKDEQIAKDLKRKQREEQVKNDGQIAKELQNQYSEIAYEDSSGLRDYNSVSSESAEKSLKEKGKGKRFEENNISTRTLLDEDEDEQLDEVIRESLKDKGKGKQSEDEMKEDQKLPEVIPPRSICGGCDSEIEHGQSVDISGVLWHPDCLWCDACHQPISTQVENHVNARGKYHKSCYERYCYICKEKKMRRYNEHPFWKERYCPTHESDGTHTCCSCERLEPRGTNYVMLGDTRWLCLECMESAVMDSHECQPLHFEIREYFEGLHMKIEKEFPFLLVEKQALNKAEKKEKIENQYKVVTRGICLSEVQTVTSVSKARRTGPHNEQIDKVTESQTVFGDCAVTAILILFGLPRLLTGYILAHEMTHAYLRLNGHRKLNNVREEGICQVLGHMWLESQTYASSDAAIEAEAASSSRTPLAAANTSKKGKWTGFEKKLVEFCKNQIETDESRVYGVGFRRVNEMVTNSNLKETLKEIIRLG